MSTGVYKYVPPTRKYQGKVQEVKKPTTTTYSRQIGAMVRNLETQANELWSTICERRKLCGGMLDFFKAHNTALPTLYVLLKTHKFETAEITSDSDILGTCKVRPIVSCCGSPTEKIAWLVTTILSPLLNEVPSHLQDIGAHLKLLTDLPLNKLRGLQFCSADATSLYTNININGCIEDIISFATEHQDKLQLYGLQLVDLHQMLELVFGNAYFCFDNRLYLQLIGLFMGCKPSPLGAIIRVYMFERNSIYIDIHYLPLLFYKRYVDDGATLARSEEHATNFFNSIAQQDPDGRLEWEVDFPDSEESFTPFLSTQIRVDADGHVHSKFYRKKQKKSITLHYLSHHPFKTKVEVIKQFYKTAEASSSSPAYADESKSVIDHLLQCNGYSDPRQYITYRFKGTGPKSAHEQSVTLKLPYISETVSEEIRKFIKNKQLPINIIFKPGVKLQELFCSSRPHDKPKCVLSDCKICPNLPDGYDCTMKSPLYRIKCQLCNERYIGESCRTVHDRLSEHLRFANNPLSPSYLEEAMAVHYRRKHEGEGPDLKFEVIRTESNTILRKIFEAYFIYNQKPEINDKSEIKLLQRFLVNGDVIHSH